MCCKPGGSLPERGVYDKLEGCCSRGMSLSADETICPRSVCSHKNAGSSQKVAPVELRFLVCLLCHDRCLDVDRSSTDDLLSDLSPQLTADVAVHAEKFGWPRFSQPVFGVRRHPPTDLEQRVMVRSLWRASKDTRVPWMLLSIVCFRRHQSSLSAFQPHPLACNVVTEKSHPHPTPFLGPPGRFLPSSSSSSYRVSTTRTSKVETQDLFRLPTKTYSKASCSTSLVASVISRPALPPGAATAPATALLLATGERRPRHHRRRRERRTPSGRFPRYSSPCRGNR